MMIQLLCYLIRYLTLNFKFAVERQSIYGLVRKVQIHSLFTLHHWGERERAPPPPPPRSAANGDFVRMYTYRGCMVLHTVKVQMRSHIYFNGSPHNALHSSSSILVCLLETVIEAWLQLLVQ